MCIRDRVAPSSTADSASGSDSSITAASSSGSSLTTEQVADLVSPSAVSYTHLDVYKRQAEAMTQYVIRYVLDNCPDEMAFFNQCIDKGLVERLELVDVYKRQERASPLKKYKRTSSL